MHKTAETTTLVGLQKRLREMRRAWRQAMLGQPFTYQGAKFFDDMLGECVRDVDELGGDDMQLAQAVRVATGDGKVVLFPRRGHALPLPSGSGPGQPRSGGHDA